MTQLTNRLPPSLPPLTGGRHNTLFLSSVPHAADPHKFGVVLGGRDKILDAHVGPPPSLPPSLFPLPPPVS